MTLIRISTVAGGFYALGVAMKTSVWTGSVSDKAEAPAEGCPFRVFATFCQRVTDVCGFHLQPAFLMYPAARGAHADNLNPSLTGGGYLEHGWGPRASET